LQQGNVGSTQSVTVSGLKDLDELVKALSQMPDAGDVVLKNEDRGVLEASIASLKAQTSSPAPSPRVIRELLYTVRNVAEGYVASYLASKSGIYIDQLIRSLGF
jgi:hypothetical protein